MLMVVSHGMPLNSYMLSILTISCITYTTCIAFSYLSAVLVIPALGSSLMLDAINRYNINDTFVSSYYLYWTVFFYLPQFTSVLILVIVYFARGGVVFDQSCKITILLILSNFIYVTEIVDFLGGNSTLSLVTPTDVNINTLLLNLLNRYHPLLFYASTALLFHLLYNVLFAASGFTNHYNFNLFFYSFKSKLLFILILNLVSLWLGSWWAFQEGTWGGWWNSDASEMLGLVVFIIVSTLVHKRCAVNTSRYVLASLHSGCLSFALLYFFIQINYELTSHNFGSRFFFFFNNNLLLFNLVLILSASLIFIYFTNTQLISSRKYRVDSFEAPRRVSNRSVLFLRIYSFIFFSVWIYISIEPLIDAFTRRYIHGTDTLTIEIYTFMQFLFIVVILCLFYKVTISSLTHYLPILLFSHEIGYVLFSATLVKSSVSVLIHATVSSFVVLNFCTSQLVLMYWGGFSQDLTLYTLKEVWHPNLVVFVCDSTSFAMVGSGATLSGCSETAWTQSTFFNMYDTDQFDLLFNNSTFLNCYNFISDWFSIYILIDHVDIGVINTLFMFLVVVVSKLLVSHELLYNRINFFY